MKQHVMLIASFAVVVGMGAVCEGGIVVKKNGEVFVGKIKPGETTAERIVLHNPAGEKGRWVFDRGDVRWFDSGEGEALTDAYFGQHLEDKLVGGKWIAQREAWKAARDNRDGTGDGGGPWWDPLPLSLDVVDTIPISHQGTSLCKPAGWNASVEKGILVFRASRSGRSGFTARIHVFSVDAPEGTPTNQLDWIRQELTRVSGKAQFQVVEEHRLQKLERGADQKLLTETVVDGRTVRAIRLVSCREKRTYFFAGYVDVEDYTSFEREIRASLDTLTLAEDR